jgi:hypothetical protein
MEVLIPGKMGYMSSTSHAHQARGALDFKWSDYGCHFLQAVGAASQQDPTVSSVISFNIIKP